MAMGVRTAAGGVTKLVGLLRAFIRGIAARRIVVHVVYITPGSRGTSQAVRGIVTYVYIDMVYITLFSSP